MNKMPKTVPAPKPTGRQIVNTLSPTVANVGVKNMEDTKTSGIKIRGTGAAQRGTTARGPMA